MNIRWDWLKALSGLAGAPRLPNSSAEGKAQHLFLFIYLLIKRSVYRKLCFDPGFKKSHVCFTPCNLLKSHMLKSTSHHEQTAKCIWNGKFLIEMGILELPAAGECMAKQLQRLQSLCRSCLSNNQDNFKYLFETVWFYVLKSTAFFPLCLIKTGRRQPGILFTHIMNADGRSFQDLTGLYREGKEFGNA